MKLYSVWNFKFGSTWLLDETVFFSTNDKCNFTSLPHKCQVFSWSKVSLWKKQPFRQAEGYCFCRYFSRSLYNVHQPATFHLKIYSWLSLWTWCLHPIIGNFFFSFISLSTTSRQRDKFYCERLFNSIVGGEEKNSKNSLCIFYRRNL